MNYAQIDAGSHRYCEHTIGHRWMHKGKYLFVETMPNGFMGGNKKELSDSERIGNTLSHQVDQKMIIHLVTFLVHDCTRPC